MTVKLAVNNDPIYLNDAEIIGEETPAYCDLLNREVTFLSGEMYGARDRRNTQDGDWQSVSLPWAAWVAGGPREGAERAWGLSRHPVAKRKEGSCIVLGGSVGGARKALAMDTMYAVGLDIDSGTTYPDIVDKLESLGHFAVAYTTFNHGKTGLQLKRDEVLRKLGITRDPSEEEVRDYLRRFGKNRYEESFIAGCTILEQKSQTTEGVKIILDTPPLEKFRVIFPLAEPVKLINLADTQDAALRLWEDKVTGLARNVLGVHFDVACTDASRLFYTPRHREGGNWDCTIVRGDPLVFADIPAMKKAAYAGGRDANAFTQAGGETAGDRPPQCYTPSGKSLNDWHRDAKGRFQIADLLETLCADKVRVAGGEGAGHVHTECPFEHEHSEEGGTATMAINALDSQNGYWTWFCHHDACQGRHKLQFLEEALRAGWFDENALTDLDSGFLLDVADGETDPFESAEVKNERGANFEERAAQFEYTTANAVDVETFIGEAHAAGIDDVAQRERINEAIKKVTALGVPIIRDMWTKCDRAAAKLKKKRKGGKFKGILTTESAPALTQYAAESVKGANARAPFLFEYMEGATIVRGGRILTLDRPGRRHALGKVTAFQKPKGDECRHVYPPYDVVDDLFSSDLSSFCLPLRGAVDTPFFAADGTLVTETGYHAGSQMYLDSGVAVDRVSGCPSDIEVQAAKDFIIENVLADFPLDGLTRAEILEGRNETPAVTHAIALTLLPFMREMVDGPTPGWILVKPAAGTGASLLVKLLTTIASGKPAPELSLPTNKEEVPKTLSAVLQNCPAHIVFDNINHTVDSGELASAQTARTYQARVLGRTQTIEVDVRSIFVFTANNVTISTELMRRSVFIPLDAKVESPDKRTGFLHADAFAWVSANRARLVHACLTLIQNWVAQGMERSAHSLASFEDWAAVTGGVLEAAGFGKFLEGQEESKAMAVDATQDGIDYLMDALADFPDGTYFRPGGSAKFKGACTVNIVDILNGVERAGADALSDKPDPIQINGWGYNDYDGCYGTAGRVRPGFDKLARKPRRGRASDGSVWILHFEASPDTRNKGVVYKMTKKEVPDADVPDADVPALAG